jgi:phosphatidate phosphatase APP1
MRRTPGSILRLLAAVQLAGACEHPSPPPEPKTVMAEDPPWTLPADMEPSDLAQDEVVAFIPAYATRHGAKWRLPLEAWVYEPEEDGLVRSGTLEAIEDALELDGRDETTRRRVLENLRPFMVDNEGAKTVVVRIGDTAAVVGTSGADGRCGDVVELTARQAEAAAQGNPPALEYAVVLGDGDTRRFSGWVQLLDDAGVSVISDIDDTIKITEVHDKKKLLENTFARPFQPAPGMPALYRRWADEGAAFHYISNSPLPLLHAITAFITAEGFPMGSLGLKPFRWKDGTFLDLFAAPEAHKQAVIEGVVESFAKRRFVLVGDTGERDPEIYAAVARKHPDRIARIYLRDPQPGGTPDIEPRLAAAFEGLPRELWVLFTDATAIRDGLPPTRGSARRDSSAARPAR